MAAFGAQIAELFADLEGDVDGVSSGKGGSARVPKPGVGARFTPGTVPPASPTKAFACASTAKGDGELRRRLSHLNEQ